MDPADYAKCLCTGSFRYNFRGDPWIRITSDVCMRENTNQGINTNHADADKRSLIGKQNFNLERFGRINWTFSAYQKPSVS